MQVSSLGESVSGLNAYKKAKQISEEEFDKLDTLAYKLENGLLKLVESLELKRDRGEWNDSLIIKECNETYQVERDCSTGRMDEDEVFPILQHSEFHNLKRVSA